MKLQHKEHVTSTNIHSASSQFRIAITPKAFEALSSNLYKDKPLAVVRELLCNARDSHKEANNPEPIEVIVPTYNSQSLTIRDYGTGMTHYKVMQLYTTYFRSDRTVSDEYTGGFGLGSKTPYAVSEQFTVESTVTRNGITITSMYQCYRNAEGMPSIMRVSRVQSDPHKHPGVCVSIPALKDYYRFTWALGDVIRYLDHPVHLLNHEQIQPQQYVCEVEVGDWTACIRGEGTDRIVMSGVSYPSPLVVTDYRNAAPARPYTVDWKVPPGTFTPTVSRESLEWVPAMEAVFAEKYKSLALLAKAPLRMAVTGAPTFFQANSLRQKYLPSASETFSWRGFRLSDRPDSPPDIVPVSLTHNHNSRKSKKAIANLGVAKQTSDPAVYWGLKRHQVKAESHDSKEWSLVLFGPKDQALAFLSRLGLKDLPVRDAAELKPFRKPSVRKAVRMEAYVNTAPAMLYDGMDCRNWVVGEGNVSVRWLCLQGVFKTHCEAVSVTAGGNKTVQYIQKHGGFASVEAFLAQAPLDYARAVQVLGWADATRWHESPHKAFIHETRNTPELDTGISFLRAPYPGSLSCRAEEILRGLVEDKDLAREVKRVTKELSALDKRIDRFRSRNPKVYEWVVERKQQDVYYFINNSIR